MAKGGARATSGPAPDPDALKRDRDGGSWRVLPVAGRVGPVPVWPLSEASEREMVLWAGEWVRPQAVEWERNGQGLEVALYVRSLVAAEVPDAATAARTLVRQQQEALGLSLPGLARNRWRIADGPAEVEAGGQVVRARFRVVTGDRAS